MKNTKRQTDNAKGGKRLKRHELPVPSEEDEQATLFRWAEWNTCTFPELKLMFHVPNEGKRSIQRGAMMRRIGLKAGVPDICLPVPRGIWHGMFIEMKRQKGGTLGDSQREWIEALTKQGYYCIVARGWEVAAKEIQEYLQI